jgi:hypothetical protein
MRPAAEGRLLVPADAALLPLRVLSFRPLPSLTTSLWPTDNKKVRESALEQKGSGL